MKKRLSERGFTLMELMVVIVIVAILAAVAVPLYINYVKDAKRTEAKGAIAAVITAEQVYLQQSSSGSYTDEADLNTPQNLRVDVSELKGRGWNLAVTKSSASGFTVTAENTNDETLSICCVYTRTEGAKWFASDCTTPL